jgi:hypothetical protein
MSSDPKKTAAIGSAANGVRAAKRAEVERTVAAARLKIQQEKAIKENAERERQRLEQEKETERQAQSRELALEAAVAPIRGQQSTHRPFNDVAPQTQMTKPFSLCSLSDLAHEISLGMPALAALLLPCFTDEELVTHIMQYQSHPLVQGASGLQCTDTVDSERAWCSMLRNLFGASGIDVSDAVLYRVYVVCQACSRRGLVRLGDAAALSVVGGAETSVPAGCAGQAQVHPPPPPPTSCLIITRKETLKCASPYPPYATSGSSSAGTAKFAHSRTQTYTAEPAPCAHVPTPILSIDRVPRACTAAASTSWPSPSTFLVTKQSDAAFSCPRASIVGHY